MKRIIWVIVLLLLGSGVWWWLRPGPPPVNYPPTATGPWIAFGDSLTQGYGANKGEDYPSVLGQLLHVTIENQGVPGQSTVDAMGRLEAAADRHPRVVLLCLGGNDALQQLPPDTTFGNLSKMIDRFHQAGSFVVLIGVRSASLLDQNEKRFAKLAKEKHVFYVPDILSGIMFKPVLMSDAIHPNAQGYRQFAERLQQELQPYLAGLR